MIVKKWLYSVSLCIALFNSVNVQAAASKIAVVNFAEIFQKLPAREAAAKKLEKEFAGRATELQRMEKDLQAKIANFQRDRSVMKESVRSQSEKEIQAQQQAFSTKAQQFEEDNRRRQAEERDTILKRIQEAVKTVAAQEGYDMVVDANTVAYSASGTDITATVLKKVK